MGTSTPPKEGRRRRRRHLGDSERVQPPRQSAPVGVTMTRTHQDSAFHELHPNLRSVKGLQRKPHA